MDRISTNPHIENLRRKKNGYFPNNNLPVLIYRNAMDLPGFKNKAAKIAQEIFLRNGWSNSWRNGIYDFHHYHSNTHECMAIVSGTALVIVGGPGRPKIKVSKGDVIILPAGTGHKCLKHDKDFLCVGAYPNGKNYDIHCGKSSEYDASLPRIEKIPRPSKDPVFGKEGFLKSFWEK